MCSGGWKELDLFLCVESLSCDYGEKVLDDGDFQLLPWFRGLLRNARIALTDRYNRECLTRKLCTHHLSTIFSATSNVTCIERKAQRARASHRWAHSMRARFTLAGRDTRVRNAWLQRGAPAPILSARGARLSALQRGQPPLLPGRLSAPVSWAETTSCRF